MIKYFCDRCDKELEDSKRKILAITFPKTGFATEERIYCEDCLQTVLKTIREKING